RHFGRSAVSGSKREPCPALRITAFMGYAGHHGGRSGPCQWTRVRGATRVAAVAGPTGTIGAHAARDRSLLALPPASGEPYVPGGVPGRKDHATGLPVGLPS